MIDRLEIWAFLNTFDPGDEGFMFSSDASLQLIEQEIGREYG